MIGEGIRRILIVRLSALGDVIHVLPALAALRSTFPEAKITWVSERSGASLIDGHPDLERVVVLERKGWARDLARPLRWPRILGEVRSTLGELRQDRFDLAIDFQGNLRSGLVTRLSGAKLRLGFHRRDAREGSWLFTNLRIEPAKDRLHKVDRNLELIRALGFRGDAPLPSVPIPESDREWASGVVKAPRDGPVLVLHPGTSLFGRFKQWTSQGYATVADRAARELGARVIISRGPGDERIIDAILGHVSSPVEAVGPLPLQRFAALVSRADLLIGSDSGPLHLAAATGTPVLGLYGPKDPRVYGPRGPRARWIRSAVPCSPCPLRRCDHRVCMTSLSAQDVFRMVQETLGARPGEDPAKPASAGRG